jgi:hypothetical protein
MLYFYHNIDVTINMLYFYHNIDVTDYLVSKAVSPPPGCLATQVIAYEFNLTYVSPTVEWPTPNGLTEITALQHCKTKIEDSVAFQGCKHITAINFVIALDSCVADLQVRVKISLG